jgi:hypothetical protein
LLKNNLKSGTQVVAIGIVKARFQTIASSNDLAKFGEKIKESKSKFRIFKQSDSFTRRREFI